MNTQNKPHKLSLNQETLRTLTAIKHPEITGTCLISLCIQTNCPATVTVCHHC